MNTKNITQENIFGVEMIEIFLLLKENSFRNKKVSMKINKFEQLGILKEKIKSQFEIKAIDIILLTRGKILRGDHKIIKDFKIEPKQVTSLLYPLYLQ